MANLNVKRNGGLGDIINILYFCNYYKKSGHNINFVCNKNFHEFIKLQKVTNTVSEKLFKNNYFNLFFDGREHSDLKDINNNVYDIFYRHGNNLIQTEPLYFEIKTDKECDKKVLDFYNSLKRPIVCVNSIASAINRSFNISDTKKLFNLKFNGTLVNISHYIEFENVINAFSKLPKTLTMFTSLIKHCDLLFTCNTGSLHIGNNFFKPTITFDSSWPISEYDVFKNPNLYVLPSSSDCINCKRHGGCNIEEIGDTVYKEDKHKLLTPKCCSFNSSLVIDKINELCFNKY